MIDALILSHPPNNLPLLQSLLLSRHTFWISAIVLLGLRNVLNCSQRGPATSPAYYIPLVFYYTIPFHAFVCKESLVTSGSLLALVDGSVCAFLSKWIVLVL